MTLRDAFAQSSNVAAVRLSERVGRDERDRARRAISASRARSPNDPSVALGTST